MEVFMKKRCSKCKEWKVLSDFSTLAENKIDGRYSRCRVCLNKEYRERRTAKEPYIYRLTNTVTGTHYIGRSTLTVKERLYSHINAMKRGVHFSKAMQADYDSYGVDSFEMVVLTKIQFEDRKAIERQYVQDYLPNVYNQRLC
jgi:hypothetical protein